MVQITSVLIAPVVTEKTVAVSGKYTFSVHLGATKKEVAQAVTYFYGVKVLKVNVTNLPSKKRIIARGKTVRKRSKIKKATVVLEEGKKLDFNAFK